MSHKNTVCLILSFPSCIVQAAVPFRIWAFVVNWFVIPSRRTDKCDWPSLPSLTWAVLLRFKTPFSLTLRKCSGDQKLYRELVRLSFSHLFSSCGSSVTGGELSDEVIVLDRPSQGHYNPCLVFMVHRSSLSGWDSFGFRAADTENAPIGGVSPWLSWKNCGRRWNLRWVLEVCNRLLGDVVRYNSSAA